MDLRDAIFDALMAQDVTYLTTAEVDELTSIAHRAADTWIVEERVAGRLMSTAGMAARPVEVRPNRWIVKATLAHGIIPRHVHSMPAEFRVWGVRKGPELRMKSFTNERTAKSVATMLRNAHWASEVVPCYESLVEL